MYVLMVHSSPWLPLGPPFCFSLVPSHAKVRSASCYSLDAGRSAQQTVDGSLLCPPMNETAFDTIETTRFHATLFLMRANPEPSLNSQLAGAISGEKRERRMQTSTLLPSAMAAQCRDKLLGPCF